MTTKIALPVVAAVVISFALSTATRAADFRPTQADLNSLAFIDFWPTNGATLDSKVVVPHQGLNPNSGVKYTFDTGRNLDNLNEGYSRTQFETPAGSFMPDLLGFDNFAVNFLSNFSSTSSTLQAQLYLRYVGGAAFTSSGPVTLDLNTQTRVSIPITSIPLASRSQITAFGFEVFAQNAFDNEVNSQVSAYRVPLTQDTILFSWETPDNPATPAVNEAFQGWTTGFHSPSNVVHSIYTDPTPGPGPPGAGDGIGATEGSHALKISRTYDGVNTFRWSSQYELAAGPGGGSAIGDYNNDTSVNALDYTRWRNNFGGAATTLQNRNPANMSATVGESHFTDWKTHYGDTGGGVDPIQTQINNLVALIENPSSYSFAFDVTVIPNVDTPPSFLSIEMSISDSDGVMGTPDHFFQAQAPALLANQVGITQDTRYSLEIPLANFKDVQAGSADLGKKLVDVGLYNNTSYLRLALSSNLNGDLDYIIDNFRIRQIVPEGAGSGGGAIPEPSAMMLAFLAMAGGAGARRRRNSD